MRAQQLKDVAMVFLLAGAIARSARADPSPSQTVSKDTATAQRFFDEAKRNMASGDYLAACPKLEESYRIDPGSGTLTALAVCHENIGRTATAWAEFVEVAAESRQQGRADREAFAQLHIAALGTKVSRMDIRVAPEAAHLPGLRVQRDGVAIAPAAWGAPAPIDPGDHLIEVFAPGKQSWTTRVVITADGATKVVSVPALQDAPQDVAGPPAPADQPIALAGTPPAADTSTSARETGTSLRAVALALGGAGVAAVAVGAVFGVEAISKRSEAKDACPGQTCSSLLAVQQNNAAKTDALASNIFVVAGLAALGGGAYLYLVAPKAGSPSTAARHAGWIRLAPLVTAHTGGFLVQSVW
jgi:hypothetical protein